MLCRGAPAVAVVRLRVAQRGVGGLHVVLESAHADPPYLLENRTPFSLSYCQVCSAVLVILLQC